MTTTKVKDPIEGKVIEDVPNLKESSKKQKEDAKANEEKSTPKQKKIPSFKAKQRKAKLMNIVEVVLGVFKGIGGTFAVIMNQLISHLGIPVVAGLAAYVVICLIVGVPIVSGVWWAMGITTGLVIVNNLIVYAAAGLL